MEEAAASPTRRFDFLDLLRGVFILVMVEGHTFRALLDAAIKAGAVYRYHELIHNFSGPAFLFAAGVAFSFSSHRHWDSYRRGSARLRGRLLHWLAVLLLGYALQLTYFSLRRSLQETTPEQLSFLLSLNILQCIVFSLVLLQILVMVAPGWPAFFWSAVSLAVGITLATPFLWNAAPRFPVWLGAALGSYSGSIFPLFPYSGFALAGAAWGHLYSLAHQQGAERPFLRRTLRFSAWLCLASVAVAGLPLPQIYSDFWYTSPLFFFLRVGLLALFTAGLRLAEPRLLPRLRVLVVIGQESLLIYAAHLVILFGSAWNPDTSMVKLLGRAHAASEVLLIWLLFTGAMTLLAWWWSWWKQEGGWRAAAVKWGLAVYFTYSFLTC